MLIMKKFTLVIVFFVWGFQVDNLSEQNFKYQKQIGTLNRRLKNLQV